MFCHTLKTLQQKQQELLRVSHHFRHYALMGWDYDSIEVTKVTKLTKVTCLTRNSEDMKLLAEKQSFATLVFTMKKLWNLILQIKRNQKKDAFKDFPIFR